MGTAEALEPRVVCFGCGRRVSEVYDVYEREVWDLPCFEFRTRVLIEPYRARYPALLGQDGEVQQLPSKAPFRKRFEEAVGHACESAPLRRVGKQEGLAASTVRAVDVR